MVWIFAGIGKSITLRFEEHLQRMLSAVHLEKVDRVPFMSSGSAVNAALTGVNLAEYCADMSLNCETNLKGIQMYSDPDGVQVTIFQPACLVGCWLSETLVPGRGLPDNELWQVHEKEILKQEDYDAILEGGFASWYQQVLVERLGNPMPHIGEFVSYMGTAIGIFAENGYPCFCGNNFYTPIEMFCGGRTLMNFFTEDLFAEYIVQNHIWESVSQ